MNTTKTLPHAAQHTTWMPLDDDGHSKNFYMQVQISGGLNHFYARVPWLDTYNDTLVHSTFIFINQRWWYNVESFQDT